MRRRQRIIMKKITFHFDMIELEEYANRVGIPLTEIMSKRRLRKTTAARYVYWLYLRDNGYKLIEIAKMFNMNPVTVFSGIETIRDLISVNDAYLKRFLEAIEYKNL